MSVRAVISPVRRSETDVLSPAERARAGSFQRVEDRWAYVCAHVLLRHELSRHDPSIAPEQWRLTPQRPGHVLGSPLRWSLSHTRGQVAVIVSNGVPCGIDTESGRVDDWEELGQGLLSPREHHWLLSLPRALRCSRFRWLWTVKEALAKATGRGLGEWLAEITVVLDGKPSLEWLDPPLPFTVALLTTPIPAAVAILGGSTTVHWELRGWKMIPSQS